jgi:hypothetical protein
VCRGGERSAVTCVVTTFPLAASATNRPLAFVRYQQVKWTWRKTDDLVGVGTTPMKIPKSFWEELQEIKQQMQQEEQKKVEPWLLRLECLRGKVGDDGLERISTQAIFDFLEISQRSRGAGASRRLAKLMTELGWTPVRLRDLTCGGYKEQIRGYCRDAR